VSAFKKYPGETGLALLSGLLFAAAFPKAGLDFLAWAALLPLLYAIRVQKPKGAFWLGFVFGMAHNAALLYWIEGVVRVYGKLPVFVSVPALLLLAAYMALYPAVFAWALRMCVRKPARLVFAAPLFWVALDYLKIYLFSGFPWELAGYSQYQRLWLIQTADIFGVHGVTALILLCNAALLLVVLHVQGRRWVRTAPSRGDAALASVFVCAAFALAGLHGVLRLAETRESAARAGTWKVGVVQANISQDMKWDEDQIGETLARYKKLTLEKCKGADLVVWPETALPFYFLRDPRWTPQAAQDVREFKSWLLAGAPAYEEPGKGKEDKLFNSAYLLDPDGGVAGRHDKAHLVPYGEYVPLQRFFPFIDKLVAQVGDFARGEEGSTLAWGGHDLGVLVCYEVIFPDIARKQTAAGADLLVNITNDAWFGTTSAPYQHFSMAVFRAVENKRPLARAANTGISGHIGPDGVVLFQTPLETEAAEMRNLPKTPPVRPILTFYTRHGDIFVQAASVIALLLLLWNMERKWTANRLARKNSR
jgi:apolipoprotein N-acyltransferase